MSERSMNIAVLVSGGGTNLSAIMDAIDDGRIKNAGIVKVISNNSDAYALERAKRRNIDTAYLSPKDFDDRADYDRALLLLLEECEADLVVLAGFLVVVPPLVVKAYENRIINIHPSLIPSFCGKGYYGLKVHEAALDRGVRITGATVHYVDCGTDTGPIIAQRAVEVKEGDTPEALQRRVMEEAEWIILPQAIADIAEDFAGRK